jgi:hypothetical protein
MGEFCMACVAHLFVLSNDSQACLELVAAAVVVVVVVVAAVRNGSRFLQSNVLGGSFPWARNSGYQRFDSGWCFISP